jgi:isopentenyl-diphosphate delta-isomerase
MGIDVPGSRLVFIDTLLYRAAYNEELSEHELDHVFVGEWDGAIVLNEEEAAAYKWKPPDDLVSDMQTNPSRYTPWFATLVLKKNILGRLI